MRRTSTMLATSLLTAGLLTGCGGADHEISKCESGWSAPEVSEPYKVMGILSAIGQRAIGQPGSTDDVVHDTFVDDGLVGWRNNADELSELFCKVDDEVVLSPHGVQLVAVAVEASQPNAEQLVEFLPYLDTPAEG